MIHFSFLLHILAVIPGRSLEVRCCATSSHGPYAQQTLPRCMGVEWFWFQLDYAGCWTMLCWLCFHDWVVTYFVFILKLCHACLNSLHSWHQLWLLPCASGAVGECNRSTFRISLADAPCVRLPCLLKWCSFQSIQLDCNRCIKKLIPSILCAMNQSISWALK